ncbi:hypothetical protein [Halobacillus salinus]|uniref:hypothetical protein n=1 Tax=Halobacillus salinus TaxID=192814 RepID=UPI00130544A6|nr:hypothetical protein [Halobacillus salinus]
MSRTLAIFGWIAFFCGIGLYVLDILWFLDVLVPVFTIGGLSLLAIAMFLSFSEQKKSR